MCANNNVSARWKLAGKSRELCLMTCNGQWLLWALSIIMLPTGDVLNADHLYHHNIGVLLRTNVSLYFIYITLHVHTTIIIDPHCFSNVRWVGHDTKSNSCNWNNTSISLFSFFKFSVYKPDSLHNIFAHNKVMYLTEIVSEMPNTISLYTADDYNSVVIYTDNW